MPFLDFPTNWPVFPDKTQIADFLQFYAQTLDLQIWLRTEFKSASYDDDSGQWTIETVTEKNNLLEQPVNMIAKQTQQREYDDRLLLKFNTSA